MEMVASRSNFKLFLREFFSEASIVILYIYTFTPTVVRKVSLIPIFFFFMWSAEDPYCFKMKFPNIFPRICMCVLTLAELNGLY